MPAISTFKRMNTLDVLVVAKRVMENWNPATTLLRMCYEDDNDSAELIISCVDEAKNSLDSMQVRKSYTIQIPGACVKKGKLSERFGLESSMEASLKFKVQWSACAKDLSGALMYNCTALKELDDKKPEEWVDICGIVRDFRLEDQSSLAKKVITIVQESFHEKAFLLGPHAEIVVNKGDKLSMKGCQIKEWNCERTLQTSFLTVVEVNSTNESLPRLPSSLDDTPTKKACKTTAGPVQTCSELKEVLSKMYEQASKDLNDIPKDHTCIVVAALEDVADAIFDGDAIFYGPNHSKFRFTTSLVDAEARLEKVTIWDGAVRDILHVDGETLQGLWESCEQGDSQKRAFIDKLNSHNGAQFRLTCVLRVNLWGEKKDKVQVQVSVNAAIEEENQ